MGESIGEQDKVQFIEANDRHFKEIQQFLMIVKDWAEETVHSYDEASPKKRPDIQGIQGFYDTQQVEVSSPMRKKKKGGLVKLNLQVEGNKPAADNQKAVEGLQSRLDQILSELTQKKSEFQGFQSMERS